MRSHFVLCGGSQGSYANLDIVVRTVRSSDLFLKFKNRWSGMTRGFNKKKCVCYVNRGRVCCNKEALIVRKYAYIFTY